MNKGQPHGETDQQATEQPLLQALGAGVALQPTTQRGTGQCVGTVEQQTDTDQHQTQYRKLCEYRPLEWIDELRQLHRSKQQRLGVEQIGQQAATDRFAPAWFFIRRTWTVQARQHRRAQTLDTDP